MRTFAMVTTKSSAEYTKAALESFFANTPLSPGDAFYLIDNDGSWDPRFAAPEISSRLEVIRNSEPRSFASNANQSIHLALEKRSDLFFLNNDLIFTRGWLPPLEANPLTLFSPLSNREVQYTLTVAVQGGRQLAQFALRDHMSLEGYVGNEFKLQAIAESHSGVMNGELPLLTLPFFGIRLPIRVLQDVGLFDESFGIGGGEDFDYCLRAWLHGFRVCFALRSYVLHFGGKATWAVETVEQRRGREERFVNAFIDKWGRELHDLAFNFDQTPKDDERGLVEAMRAQNFRYLVETLSNRKVNG